MASLELKNKIVVVSGAANGIGAATVVGLLQEGAYPVGIDIEPFSGSELQRKTKRFKKDRLQFIEGDASDEDGMRDALSRFGLVHGLVNNAGLLGGDKKHGGFNPASLRKMMDAHVVSAQVLTQAVRARMPEGGSIVNIGSIETIMAEPGVVSYSTAKGALWGMTVAYANELAPDIRVNMVSPGNVDTERNKAQYKAPGAAERIRSFEARTPLRRSLKPKEIADTILFLLSPRSSGIIGANLVVDGGYTRALTDPTWVSHRDI